MIAWWITAAVAGPMAEQVALHFGRDGRRVDSETLAPAYQALCDGGLSVACNWRAWDDWGRVKADVLARLVEPGCRTSGDPDLCAVTALALGVGDGSWNGKAPDQAEVLLGASCAAGDPRGCRECRSLADHGALGACSNAAALPPVPAGSCTEGWLSACEGPASSGDVAALERLCTAVGEPWCTPLAAARRDAPVPVPADAPADAWVTPSGFLLGWRGPRWTEHALVAPEAVRGATLVIRPALDEGLILDIGAPDAPVLVPLPHGCAALLAGLVLLPDVQVRGVGEDGGPARSACAEIGGPNVPYLGGELAVVPVVASDDGFAAEVKAALTRQIAPLFICTARLTRAPQSPALLALTRGRAGPPKKVVVTGGSGSADYDGCVLAWVRATDLGATSVPARFTVRVDLDW